MRDDKVREAIRAQKTLISTDPSAQPIQDAIAIAKDVLGEEEVSSQLSA